MAREKCRLPQCDEPPRRGQAPDAFAGAFCSTEHELKYEHIRDDARDAKRAAEAEAPDPSEFHAGASPY